MNVTWATPAVESSTGRSESRSEVPVWSIHWGDATGGRPHLSGAVVLQKRRDPMGGERANPEGAMDKLTLENPVFATYVVAATIMILKAVSMSWLTVALMMKAKGGFRSPEDLKKTPLNPNPDPKQLEPNPDVERVRRIHLNDLENIPFFLAAGLLFVLTDPSLVLARALFYTYVVTRLLHFVAYFTSRTHDTRAALWTPGSLIILFMAGRTLLVALGAV
jgi:glutathione S-transferase